MSKINIIKIDEVEYVRKDSIEENKPAEKLDIEYVRKDSIEENKPAEKLDGLEYVIVRTYSAGVFAGYLESRNGKEVMLLKARRLWYWSGAATLSQLSVDGTKTPADCKFPCEVERVELTEAIEILPVTDKAKKTFESVAIWKM